MFVYGIFLSELTRNAYGLQNPEYTTVLDYATFGHNIVQAERIPDAGLALTGLVVDIPDTAWRRLDELESAYRRIKVITTDGEQVYMYTTKEGR